MIWPPRWVPTASRFSCANMKAGNVATQSHARRDLPGGNGDRGPADGLEGQVASARQGLRRGSIVDGLGMGLHTWGGGGQPPAAC